ncbi:MAG: tetratricopeptide repeat protein, partial [Pyrinomonadaceae bacterium]|nr:tetratricopeptide repeat protein [Pyrinomonadaceae bacterium]
FPQAERLLRRAIALDDKHFNANHDLGSMFLRSRRYTEAVPVLRRAASINPNHADVHYKLFIALSRLKRTAEAEHELGVFRRLEAQRKAGQPAIEIPSH